jgi:hypothetical protein
MPLAANSTVQARDSYRRRMAPFRRCRCLPRLLPPGHGARTSPQFRMPSCVIAGLLTYAHRSLQRSATYSAWNRRLDAPRGWDRSQLPPRGCRNYAAPLALNARHSANAAFPRTYVRSPALQTRLRLRPYCAVADDRSGIFISDDHFGLRADWQPAVRRQPPVPPPGGADRSSGPVTAPHHLTTIPGGMRVLRELDSRQ